MYQHTRLHELSLSTKVLLTGFILTVCAAGTLGLVAFHHACKDVDGEPTVSFKDLRIAVCGARQAVLERAVMRPDNFGLGGASTAELEKLKAWCDAGAPRRDFEDIARILKGSPYAVQSAADSADPASAEAHLDREYRRVARLAVRPQPLSTAEVSTGMMLYFAIAALTSLGLGILFVSTSLFEKTKIFFLTATFGFAVACPLFLWLGMGDPSWLYAMLLSGLLLGVCIGVMALVSLYDIWFRRAPS